jgi:hypothetical protein
MQSNSLSSARHYFEAFLNFSTPYQTLKTAGTDQEIADALNVLRDKCCHHQKQVSYPFFNVPHF